MNLKNLEGRLNLLGEHKGTGEYSHLGGCSKGGDAGTYYPEMWKYLVEKFSIKSVIDVGCGAGWSTKFFHDLGCKVLGVEGFQEAIDNSLVKEFLIKHDYEKDGQFIPNENFDLCWSCEFVEHVEEDFSSNFLETFKSSKYVAMTFAEPGQSGHHHVNLKPESYWIEKLGSIGFIFDREITNELRKLSEKDRIVWDSINANWFADFHFSKRGLFFKNIK